MTYDADIVVELPKGRTAPKEVRRQQLIDATIEVIAENGVSGTTMAEVTRLAGLSIGIVNLHFESKDNLLKSTLLFLSEELRDVWGAINENPNLTPAQKVWGIIDSSFHPKIFTPSKVRVWFGFFGEAKYRAFYRETVENFDNERGAVLEGLLLSLMDSQCATKKDAEALTQSIESMADGLWLSNMLYPHWIHAENSRLRLWDLLSHHYPQHFPRSAEPKIESVR